MLDHVMAGRLRRLEDGDISLIGTAEAHEVIFVYWTDAARMEGRRIKLDKFGRIMTIVPASVKKDSFSDAVVLMPHSGGVHLRTSAAGRQYMPVISLLAQKHFALQVFCGPCPPGALPGFTQCRVCMAAEASHVDQFSAIDDEDLWVCQRCHVCFHSQCASASIFDRVRAPGDLPHPFGCPFCSNS